MGPQRQMSAESRAVFFFFVFCSRPVELLSDREREREPERESYYGGALM